MQNLKLIMIEENDKMTLEEFIQTISNQKRAINSLQYSSTYALEFVLSEANFFYEYLKE